MTTPGIQSGPRQEFLTITFCPTSNCISSVHRENVLVVLACSGFSRSKVLRLRPMNRVAGVSFVVARGEVLYVRRKFSNCCCAVRPSFLPAFISCLKVWTVGIQFEGAVRVPAIKRADSSRLYHSTPRHRSLTFSSKIL